VISICCGKIPHLAGLDGGDPTVVRLCGCDGAGVFAAWGDGTGNPYDLLADDAVWTIVGQLAASRLSRPRGLRILLANVIKPFGSRMASHVIPTINEMYADGDAVVILFDAEGTARDGVAHKKNT
jgi:uncharacterized protein